MKYLFFSILLVISGCAIQSPKNLLDRDSINTDGFEFTLDSDGDGSQDNFIPMDTNFFSNSNSDGNGNSGSNGVSNSTYYPRQDREMVVIREVVKNNNMERIVNTQNDMGQVIYKVPDTMLVRRNYEVIVRISRSNGNIEIKSNLNGKITSKSIKTSNKMSVELKDPTGGLFDIKEITSQKQLVDSSYTEWRYNVMPLKSGQNKLDLVISIFKNDDVKQVVYSDEIYVQANAPAQIKSFWYNNWKWSIETLIIPVVTWLFGVWWGKRREKKKRRY